MTIILQLPPKELHPNARTHWRVKALHTKAYRLAAALSAKTWIRSGMGSMPTRWPAATVEATFYFRDARRRDRDGMLSSLKAAFDGLSDAGLIADDSGLTHLPVVVAIDRRNPRVELNVTPQNGAEGNDDERA